MNTGIIAIVANTPTILDLSFEPAVFFLMFEINLINSNNIRKSKSKNDKSPKKKEIAK